MKMQSLVLTTLLLIALDFLWFMVSVPRIYKPTFEAIQRKPFKARLEGGILAWALIALGIRYFVYPHAKNAQEALFRGALLGLIVYGVYNGTMYATLSDYPGSTMLIDMIWGVFATSVVSYVGYTYVWKV
jgi:uncharacterized membrane protein